jgi:hypothetical protein
MIYSVVQPRTSNHGIQITQWLSWADEDYLAARGMLLRGFVQQGTMLGNTAIEKYLKTGLLARHQSFRGSHDVTKLYEQLRLSGPLPNVNADFLGLLVKAYKMRYPDDLPQGFNLVLVAVKILAELDETVFALRNGFKFQRADGKPLITALGDLLEKGDSVLLDSNVAFGGCLERTSLVVPRNALSYEC